jgi:hypothetical protein
MISATNPGLDPPAHPHPDQADRWNLADHRRPHPTPGLWPQSATRHGEPELVAA